MKQFVFVLLGAGLLSCSVPMKAPDCCSKDGSSHATNASTQTTPFARVALALQGCSSCAHCRSTIRQATKSVSGAGEVQVGGDQVEVVFNHPQTVPLESVIRRLSANGLHDLTVLDVLFDAEGKVEETSSGLRFRLRETGQSFSLQVPEFQQTPPLGEMLRLRTVVRGWNALGAPLSLDLKYVIETLDPVKRAAMAAQAEES